jgi:ketosteroid isomerase-like protein
VFEELRGIARRRLELDQRLQPLVGLLLQLVDRGFVLVQPVRGDARFGDMVHVGVADLDFHRRAEGADQRGVQRLVAVGLGDRDVVLELARHRLVQRVQRAQRQVAGGPVLDDDAEAVDVQHLREAQVLLAHLAVDAVEMLFAALDIGIDAGGRQCLADGVEDLADHFAPVAARVLDGSRQHAVAQRMGVAERQFLQLAVERVQAQAVGDRRIDVERLARDARRFSGAHRVQRAHVVQPVGELDQDDAHVARHRQQHLAEVFRLGLFEALELDAVQLGDAVDQVGGHLPKRSAICSLVIAVSSITSCSSAAVRACASRCQPARVSATASGWEM